MPPIELHPALARSVPLSNDIVICEPGTNVWPVTAVETNDLPSSEATVTASGCEPVLTLLSSLQPPMANKLTTTNAARWWIRISRT